MKLELPRLVIICCLLFVACTNSGCSQATTSKPGTTRPAAAPVAASPELGPGREIEAGVRVHEVDLLPSEADGKVWVYLPQPLPMDKAGCVLIAPAGSPCVHGMALTDGDRPEHLPFVRAGMAVVAYELSGSVPDGAGGAQQIQGVKAFAEAEAGVADARRALDYALAKVPQIDAQRIYTSGHSSAGTVSLLVAEHEPRVKACIAFAPRSFLAESLGEAAIAQLSQVAPGFRDLVKRGSPSTAASKLRCPLFLFHAEDDSVVPIDESKRLVEMLAPTNKQVKFVRVPDGDHHSAMLDPGIPQAIAWLKTLP